jgi:hypothetical protein
MDDRIFPGSEALDAKLKSALFHGGSPMLNMKLPEGI